MATASLADLGLVELRNPSPLTVQLLPSGALFALRHETTLLNQLLTDPTEDGLFRLCARVLDASGPRSTHKLVGAGLGFSHAPDAARWQTAAADESLQFTTQLHLHPALPAWSWHVRVRNHGTSVRRVDVLHAQDIGLADEAAVRNNEAYTSQYIDLLPQRDDALGWTICARQNQAASGGRHPWLVFACASGADAYCTDGWQFFGADHRFTNRPLAIETPALPSTRLQYEFALAGLQSRARDIAPGAEEEFVFVARFLADHADATSSADLELLRAALPIARRAVEFPASVRRELSLFQTAPVLHGASASREELRGWFPGKHRHVEAASDGALLSFFCGEATHVVTREKEISLARPHGHILRSGPSTWIDDEQFGVTCYAAGVFGAQVYLGNSSFCRLLPVVRNALNVVRSSGQRLFVRRSGGAWQQLGIPSAFAMTPSDARWLYRIERDVIEVRVSCSANLSASYLELKVHGAAHEFLITHQLLAGTVEFEHAAPIQVQDSDCRISCSPAHESLTGKHLPNLTFAVAAATPAQIALLGGSELLYPVGETARGGHAVFCTRPVQQAALIMTGSFAGEGELAKTIAAARREIAERKGRSSPPSVRLHLAGPASVARVDEVLPWFNHNASIHFSAPHGLEQYGGAAWGVRDVCQGSVEWLLAIGEFGVVRRILATVFAQQYSGAAAQAEGVEGAWPQWFMFPPFHFIQQAHSHGDVCFWPVKALCDYVEASGDFDFLSFRTVYTNPKTFTPTEPRETLWEHCDRVLAHCESRFVAGTALVNYGDGDWDDTLQPADPALRTRLVSAWTVGLAFHSFRQLAALSRRAGESARADRLDDLLARMRTDFGRYALIDGVVSGFLLTEKEGSFRPLLHPNDALTGIRYRLLPMTRSILAELFTPEEAKRHLEIVENELRFPDGVRLMSEPAVYHGGVEKLFKRAETAANVGREIGLQYVHAQIRYAEALAKVGDAERLWTALQVINPVALAEVVPNAMPRQSNVYFSSSDADFGDRYEARRRWAELRSGSVGVRGGWRLYSSGPGLYLHKVRACLLGVRESFGDVVFDPVIPRELDGLRAETKIGGHAVTLCIRALQGTYGPKLLRVNGTLLSGAREPNPYREGGVRIPLQNLAALFTSGTNEIEIHL